MTSQPYDPAQISLALQEMQEIYMQLVEMAEGYKKNMESRGWSPTAAESAALTLLQRLIEVSVK